MTENAVHAAAKELAALVDAKADVVRSTGRLGIALYPASDGSAHAAIVLHLCVAAEPEDALRLLTQQVQAL